jgi:hypothetical protein
MTIDDTGDFQIIVGTYHSALYGLAAYINKDEDVHSVSERSVFSRHSILNAFV